MWPLNFDFLVDELYEFHVSPKDNERFSIAEDGDAFEPLFKKFVISGNYRLVEMD